MNLIIEVTKDNQSDIIKILYKDRNYHNRYILFTPYTYENKFSYYGYGANEIDDVSLIKYSPFKYVFDTKTKTIYTTEDFNKII